LHNLRRLRSFPIRVDWILSDSKGFVSGLYDLLCLVLAKNYIGLKQTPVEVVSSTRPRGA